jgi:putative transposase
VDAEHPQGLCLDQGYDYAIVYELVDEFGYTAHIRPWGSGSGVSGLTPEELDVANVKAPRWVVERTHSWLNRFRGLLIRWCKKAKNHLAMLHFACALITYRAAGLSR